MKCSLGISNFLEKISLVFPIYCFLYFFALITEEVILSLLFFGTLHSSGYISPFPLCLSLIFFSQLFVRPPQTTILPFCISFSWGLFWSVPPVQCHEPVSIVLQALLSDLEQRIQHRIGAKVNRVQVLVDWYQESQRRSTLSFLRF